MQKFLDSSIPELSRREFVLRGASLAALPFVLADCGGDNSGEPLSAVSPGLYYPLGADPGALTITSTRGKVVLPDGAMTRVAAVVNLASVGTPDATGSFSIGSAAEAPLLAIGYAPSGLPILYGFLQDGAMQLSAQSTAVTLAYVALGVAAYPPEIQTLYLGTIAGSMSVAVLEKAIAAQIVAHGDQWLTRLGTAGVLQSQSDPDYFAALAQVQAALSPSALATPDAVPTPASRRIAAVARSAADGRARPLGAILDKTDIISGLQVTPDGAGSVTVTNYFRRRVAVYVDRVAYTDIGAAAPTPFPGVILPQPVKIPPSPGSAICWPTSGSYLPARATSTIR